MQGLSDYLRSDPMIIDYHSAGVLDRALTAVVLQSSANKSAECRMESHVTSHLQGPAIQCQLAGCLPSTITGRRISVLLRRYALYDRTRLRTLFSARRRARVARRTFRVISTSMGGSDSRLWSNFSRSVESLILNR